MRYGVGYDQDTGIIEAGPVRATGDEEAFIMASDVTYQAIGAVVQWMEARAFATYTVVDQSDNQYQIAVRKMP